jgi:hypothetical protein
MDWVIVQLTPWAEKTMTTLEVADELRRRLGRSDVEIYYPVIEDAAGKHNTPYSEYLFVEYTDDLPYEELEGNEIFNSVLRDPNTDFPQLVGDGDIGRIQIQIIEQETLRIDEIVAINEGPFRGNEGHIQSVEDTQVILIVSLGDEEVEATLPRSWVRGTGRRLRRRSKPRIREEDLAGLDFAMSEAPEEFEDLDSSDGDGEVPVQVPDWFIERVVRRGKFNTRVIQNGQSVKLPNEEIARIQEEQEKWLKKNKQDS